MIRQSTILVLAVILSLSALPADTSIESESDFAVLNDGKTMQLGRIVRDDYLYVSGKRQFEFKMPSGNVKEIIHADECDDFKLATQKLKDGKCNTAALYFERSLKQMENTKWAIEYCNFGIGSALFSAGLYTGYSMKDGTFLFSPPSHYIEIVLSANPKSRFMLEILPKLAVNLAEEKRFEDAECALKRTVASIKIYRNDIRSLAGNEYEFKAERAEAELALAAAEIAEAIAVSRKTDLLDVRDRWAAARRPCAKYPDLLQQVVKGELSALIRRGEYSSAESEALAIIDKCAKEPDNANYPLCPYAYNTLGKTEMKKAVEYENRGLKLQGAYAYAQARWNFLEAMVNSLDDDDLAAGACFYAGVCCDKLTATEPHAAIDAARYWKRVATIFPVSSYKKPAEDELARVGKG